MVNISDCRELDISSISDSPSELLDVSDEENDLFLFGDRDLSELLWADKIEEYCELSLADWGVKILLLLSSRYVLSVDKRSCCVFNCLQSISDTRALTS